MTPNRAIRTAESRFFSRSPPRLRVLGKGQNWRRVAHQLASAYEKRESERQRDTAIATLGLARPTIWGRAVDAGDGDPSGAGIVLASAGTTTEGEVVKARC